MQNQTRSTKYFIGTLLLAASAMLFTGCQCCKNQSDPTPSTATTTVAAAAITPAPSPKPVLPAIRIRAGSSESFTDSSGNAWLPAEGFADGETIDRSDLTIENTKDPNIYRSERYAMTAFSRPLPNGNYTVKLHFAETFEGITGAGQRVFSFNVEGREFKDFDVWVKAGGALRAYVETVKVEITDGKLDIAFTSNIENPEINGIEIVPAS